MPIFSSTLAPAPSPTIAVRCASSTWRSAERRSKLAGRLVEACKEIVGLQDDNINVEFTQHKGDEMYHTIYGGPSDDWKAGEPDKLDQKISP